METEQTWKCHAEAWLDLRGRSSSGCGAHARDISIRALNTIIIPVGRSDGIGGCNYAKNEERGRSSESRKQFPLSHARPLLLLPRLLETQSCRKMSNEATLLLHGLRVAPGQPRPKGTNHVEGVCELSISTRRSDGQEAGAISGPKESSSICRHLG